MNLSPPVAKRLGCWLASSPGRSYDWRLSRDTPGAVVAILSDRGHTIEAARDCLESAITDALDIALGDGAEKTEPQNERPSEVGDGA